MAAPGKTSETLDLVQAMNENPSAPESSSGSDSAVIAAADKPKSEDHDLNANIRDIEKLMNDIDLSFRDKVVTQESSSELVVPDDSLKHHKHHHHHRIDPEHKQDEATSTNQLVEMLKKDLIEKEKAAELARAQIEMKNIKMDDDIEWKSHNRKTEPKTFASREPDVENIQVRPEVVNCPKCGRKVAAGAINHHVRFCNNDSS